MIHQQAWSNSNSSICFACALQMGLCCWSQVHPAFHCSLVSIFSTFETGKSVLLNLKKPKAVFMDNVVFKMRNRVNYKSRHSGLDSVLTIPAPTPSSGFQSRCPCIYYLLMNFSSINLFYLIKS